MCITSQIIYHHGARLSKQHMADVPFCHWHTASLYCFWLIAKLDKAYSSYIPKSSPEAAVTNAVTFLQPRQLLWLHMDRLNLTVKS